MRADALLGQTTLTFTSGSPSGPAGWPWPSSAVIETFARVPAIGGALKRPWKLPAASAVAVSIGTPSDAIVTAAPGAKPAP